LGQGETQFRAGSAAADEFVRTNVYTAQRSKNYKGRGEPITDPFLVGFAKDYDCSKVAVIPCATVVQVKVVERIVRKFEKEKTGWTLVKPKDLRTHMIEPLVEKGGIDSEFELYTWTHDGVIVATGVSMLHMSMMADIILAKLSPGKAGAVGDSKFQFGVNAGKFKTSNEVDVDGVIVDGDKVEDIKARLIASGFTLCGDVQDNDVGVDDDDSVSVDLS